MMDNIHYGVILAAGEGLRMRPLTTYFPKITLPILDKPLLIHHLEIMQMVGVTTVYIVVSKNSHQIVQEFVARYHANDGKITCELIVQKYLGGTGHALFILEKQLTGKRFLLLLGDEYYNDVESFKRIRSNRKDNLIIGLVQYEDADRIMAGCNVQMKDNYVSQMVEKPTREQIKGSWCWDGSVVLDTTIFEALHELKDSHPSEEKDNLCIVKAMQRLIEKKYSFAVLRKKCKNIIAENRSLNV